MNIIHQSGIRITEVKPQSAVSKGFPLTDVVIPSSTAKKLQDLFHKRVCLVMDNESLLSVFGGNHTAIDSNKKAMFTIGPQDEISSFLLDCGMTITAGPAFLRMLPSLRKDLIVFHNPIDSASDFPALRSGLMEFRRKNPLAVIVSGMSEHFAKDLETLRNEGLIDLIHKFTCPDSGSINELMFQGVLLMEEKAKAVLTLMVTGGVKVHCNPNDAHETLLIEPARQ